MFDVSSLSLAEAMKKSEDYKLIRSGELLYLFRADTNFEALEKQDLYNEWLAKAVMVIDADGRVRKNRYGSTSEDW